MPNGLKITVLFFLFIPLLGYNVLLAQVNPGGQCDPGTLTLITVNGYAMVDNSHMYPLYFLDEDHNGTADYFLNFGPHWYIPNSGNASRPNNGDPITIYGGMHDPVNNTLGLPVIIVYEINGELWRDPFAAFWLESFDCNHPNCPCGLCLHDSVQTVNVSGLAIVDSTFKFNKYYLDENQDDIPDYFLNFGPPWYEPPSSASRPENGDFIDIVGGLFLPDSLMPIILVYEINGLTWRDSTFFRPHYSGGGWIYRYMTQSQYAHSPWDTACGIKIQAGWHTGGQPSMIMPDSIFCQMSQLFPQNLPQIQSQHAFAGFEVGMFNPSGSNLLRGGNQLTFNNQVQFRFHYNDIQLQGFNIDERTIQLKSWNNGSNSWELLANAQVNTLENTVTIYSQNMDHYYILTGQEIVVSIDDELKLDINSFILHQNYPNPFNPFTTINYTLSQGSQVELIIYNVLGKRLAVLFSDKEMSAGFHQFIFDARSYTSGIYFYELKVDGKGQIRKMNLIK